MHPGCAAPILPVLPAGISCTTQMLQAGCSNSPRFPGAAPCSVSCSERSSSHTSQHQSCTKKSIRGIVALAEWKGGIPTFLSLVHGKVQHNPVIQPSPVFGFLHELTELRIGDRCLIYAVCLSQASLRTSTSRFPVFKGILPNGRMTRKRPIWGFP